MFLPLMMALKIVKNEDLRAALQSKLCRRGGEGSRKKEMQRMRGEKRGKRREREENRGKAMKKTVKREKEEEG